MNCEISFLIAEKQVKRARRKKAASTAIVDTVASSQYLILPYGDCCARSTYTIVELGDSGPRIGGRIHHLGPGGCCLLPRINRSWQTAVQKHKEDLPTHRNSATIVDEARDRNN
jgi:hypothetical protein